MRSDQFIKKIRFYALISFLLPLIVINSCLLIFKFVGDLHNIKGILKGYRDYNLEINEETGLRYGLEDEVSWKCGFYNKISL